ncbi:TM2 domain-containing protein [Sediminicoccus sp. KRV36]|uniref:TM2 domain-containing protein n=1 Tax=Sediminicoccus sp. KRV36 TaxID=3133721 RepID=UPI00200BEF0C|nr:TM2 domain-containing protein [Sediminicoccus rosea]UPY35961.1 TM2 domain-containing protein [Sediminicoccus rosea]
MTPRPSPDVLARLRYEAGSHSVVLAYLIWFFLGYGGVHRMYLGRWISGLIMLALFGVSLLLTLVFVGYLGLGVIMIWWVVDALLIPGMTRRANYRLIDRLSG